ncbi:MAG: 4-alpha-glucanotransferase [Eubacteriales bacterium]|nr:4-alpha-glucanotransferase [Eubacteriales bacterium]
MSTVSLPRTSGVLLHPTSLPSPYGIGDLGREAYHFVDFLEKAGQHLWQILPLTHTGFGDSPYQSFSAFAGQPLLISPEHLVKLGLLRQEDLYTCPQTDPGHVDYGTIIPWKTALLKTAYEQFLTMEASGLFADYQEFCIKNASWLDDYALFMAIKDLNGGISWLDWDEEYRKPTKEAKETFHKNLKKEAGFYRFIQFIFFLEWMELKNYANTHKVRIIGDIPIFVSMDSADVWANQHLFQLDTKGFPTSVAGVPPDYFSATGQLWGNPLYDWDAHEQEGYAWWISRIENQLHSLDILRIDHFRGFEVYWSIPYGEETAINGKWVKGPNKKLFSAIKKALGDELPIIAEDLGVITEEVEALRDAFAFPGMKVLQFAFEDLGESSFLPHNFSSPNCVCYTGTHDNDTTRGWFETLREDCRKKTRQYLNMGEYDSISYYMVRACLASIAAYAIFPVQDILDVGKDGRMNTPGAASGNWSWRFKKGALSDDLAEELKELSRLYGRY